MVRNPSAGGAKADTYETIEDVLGELGDVSVCEPSSAENLSDEVQSAAEGTDLVVVAGGDGTVNEAANGLVGSDTPLTCLPGGSNNVFCKMLGIPNDVVDATEHLLRMADEFRPRRVDLGRMNGRHFVFAAGVGLDASVVERVDDHPYRKARFGAWYYTYAAVAIFSRRYLVRPPQVRVHAGERTLEGVTVIVQNSDPFTYFRRRPIRQVEAAGLTVEARDRFKAGLIERLAARKPDRE
jgi:diacylglycerol kinase family enzyme